MTVQRRKTKVARFLDAWLAVRQVVQAANFNRFQSAGLSATQFMTLNLIPPTGGGTTLTELAQRLNLAPPTVTQTLDSLESRGLITRTRSTVDRRHVLLALTTAGAALQNASSAEFHEHIAGLFRHLTPAQRDGLIDGLEGLAAAAGETAAASATDAGVRKARRSAPQSRPR